jgi:uncharacterized protein (TIGR00725 family)
VQQKIVGVIGASHPSAEGYARAVAVGRLVAAGGASLVCGGLGGIMEAASRGCSEAGGMVIGILPGAEPGQANPYVHLAVPTNMGHARNVIIAHTANALIAIEGEYGTLAEIAIGLKIGRPVIALGSWPGLAGVVVTSSPEEAVQLALAAIERSRTSHVGIPDARR